MDTCQESPPKGGISLLLQGGEGRKTLFPLGRCRRCLILQLTRVLFFHPLLSHTHKKKTRAMAEKAAAVSRAKGRKSCLAFTTPSFPPLRLETGGGGLREHFRKREFSRLKH